MLTLQTMMFNAAGGAQVELFEFDGDKISLGRALERGWIWLTPLSPAMSTLTKKPMTDATGRFMVTRGLRTMFNAKAAFLALTTIPALTIYSPMELVETPATNLENDNGRTVEGS